MIEKVGGSVVFFKHYFGFELTTVCRSFRLILVLLNDISVKFEDGSHQLKGLGKDGGTGDS